MLKTVAVFALGVALIATSGLAFARGRRIPQSVPVAEQTTLVRIMVAGAFPAPIADEPSPAPSSLNAPMVAEDLYRRR